MSLDDDVRGVGYGSTNRTLLSHSTGPILPRDAGLISMSPSLAMMTLEFKTVLTVPTRLLSNLKPFAVTPNKVRYARIDP